MFLTQCPRDGNLRLPGTLRASSADFCHHVLNRGNARAAVFHDDDDYAAFTELIGLACERLPMRVLAYCLLPNHFHLGTMGSFYSTAIHAIRHNTLRGLH